MYLDVSLDGGIVGLSLFCAILAFAWLSAAYQSIWFLDRDMALVFGFVTFAIVHGFAESLFKLPTFLLFILICLMLRMCFEPSWGKWSDAKSGSIETAV